MRGLAALLALLPLSGCSHRPPVAERPAEPVPVEVFVMSQCPYGVPVLQAMKEALEALGPAVDLRLHFVGELLPNGGFASLHGRKEVVGDLAQLCAAKHEPTRYLDLVLCQANDLEHVDRNWVRCARDLGIPVEPIERCLKGPEGESLLKASFTIADRRRVTGSPAVLIAGKRYEGRRDAASYVRAICAERPDAAQLPACRGLPALPEVRITVLTDRRCPSCDAGRFTAAMKSRLAAPVIAVVDYSDPAGKALYEKAGGGNLPIVLFDASLEKDPDALQAFGPQLLPAGELRKAALTSSWNPLCADAGGCENPACATAFHCRAEVPNRLELFVMSQCPFAIKALAALDELLAASGGTIDLRLHYIAHGSASDGFRSLHGPEEVAENIRQLCAAKHYGEGYRFLDYLRCRNRDIRDSDWEKCATAGIDPKVLARCAEGEEGRALHEQDIELANELGFGASPTWVVNGRHRFSAIDAAALRKSFCEHNKELPICGGKAPAAPPLPSTSAGCR